MAEGSLESAFERPAGSTVVEKLEMEPLLHGQDSQLGGTAERGRHRG